jgi:hypothetical protein
MTKEQKIIRSKVGWLELAKQLGNVSQVCKVMGYSRDSFYRFKDLYDKAGEVALEVMSRRKPNVKIRIGEEIEKEVVDLAYEQPTWGQVRVANELRKKGISISPAGVRCVWLRHDLQNTKKLLITMIIRRGFEVLFRPIEAGLGGYLSKGFEGLGGLLSRRTDQSVM